MQVATTGLERYQIMQPLGSGAQASTFRAIDRQSEREVAVKAFRLKGAASWRAFDRFERECAVLARLSHPGIPSFLDHFAHEESGDYFLVMELIEGQSLRQYMESGAKLEPGLALHLLRQGLSILGYLHAQEPPILHRDINPSNLMLDSAGALKLVDFGAALPTAQNQGQSTVTMMGTPGYIAPEQSIGQAQPRSDLYALGVSIVAAMTATSGERLPRKGLEVDLDQCVPQGPLFDFLAGCIAADPQARFETAARAYDALPSAPRRGIPPQSDPTHNAESTQLAPQELPHDLQALAKVKNPVLRGVFWLVAQVVVLGLGLVKETSELVDDSDTSSGSSPPPRAKPSKAGELLQSMQRFSDEVSPFGKTEG